MPDTPSPPPKRERIVLIHGLWLNARVMELLALRLRRHGFEVSSFSYRSVREDLTENAHRLRRFILPLLSERPHVVAHSLGGVLVMQTLTQFPELRAQLARIVLAAPPYVDTYAGRALARNGIGNRIIGNSVKQWMAQAHEPWLGKPDLGVIAGTRSVGLGQIFRGLPRPNDGTITVEETQVPGAKDHLVMHVSHSEMLVSAKVAAQIAAFLRDGEFQR